MTKDEENEIIRDIAERLGSTLTKIHQTEKALAELSEKTRGMTNEVIALFNSVQANLKEVRKGKEG